MLKFADETNEEIEPIDSWKEKEDEAEAEVFYFSIQIVCWTCILGISIIIKLTLFFKSLNWGRKVWGWSCTAKLPLGWTSSISSSRGLASVWWWNGALLFQNYSSRLHLCETRQTLKRVSLLSILLPIPQWHVCTHTSLKFKHMKVTKNIVFSLSPVYNGFLLYYYLHFFRYGCPSMEEIESYSREYKKRIDEVGALGEIPNDLALEVTTP